MLTPIRTRAAKSLVILIEAIAGPCYALVAISGIALHAYTVWTAYTLTDPGWLQYVATYAAYAFPLFSELVMIFFAQRATGSWVNAYSFWALTWAALLVFVLSLSTYRHRHRR